MIADHGGVGLILMGGGARAAYQIGVLDALREILEQAGWPDSRNPYDVICGTSAGAINAAVLAAGCDDPGGTVRSMVEIWSALHAGDIYRTDMRGALGNAAHWLGALTMGWLVRTRPRSLFDNAPLGSLLGRLVDPQQIALRLAQRQLQALAVTASSYTSGQHVTYFQSQQPIEPWSRTQRVACAATITTDHLLASSAIPFVFPAVSLALDGRREFFGDGSMRQLAPISPAIHLGARRVVVIGAGHLEAGTPRSPHTSSQFVYPSLAQIAGHSLSSIFLDGLVYDVERLTRINRTLDLIAPDLRGQSALRPIEVLAITPSRKGFTPRRTSSVMPRSSAPRRKSR